MTNPDPPGKPNSPGKPAIPGKTNTAAKTDTRPKTDIRDKNDLIMLINAFYSQVKQDPLLAPIFLQRIPDDLAWPSHLDTMYNFWNSVLFAQNDYHGSPFPKHIGLGIAATHFDRWIGYFHQTIDLYFAGPKANEAKEKSLKIRALFESKLAFHERNNDYHTP